MISKFLQRWPYILLVLFILLLDRWTKWLIDTRLLLNQTHLVIDGFFNITYVRNTGVAFGILDSTQASMKSTVLALLTAGAIIGVLIYAWRTPLNQKLLQTALSLILAGALGNLYDRIRYGYVIDFIEIYFRDYRWPSFNIADSAITTGVAFLAIEMFRQERPQLHGKEGR
jgi:signal peptidase II